MKSINLTPAEIKEVTNKTHRDKQAIVLAVMQIPFKVRPDGSILVNREAYNQVTGCVQVSPAKQSNSALPNFDQFK